MDKLIKLLDLYRRTNKTEELLGEPWTLVPLTWKDFIILNRVMIISKEYGFIKWLVDNDKIDYEKVDKSWNDEMSFVDFKLDNIMEIRIKVVLMLLSIQDEPIEFLISILK